MTIGHLIEMLHGKLGACSGKTMDATPLHDRNVQDIGKKLKKYGFQQYGNEQLFDGRTGMPLKRSDTFIGVIFYQRLRHLVADKVHARSVNGPRSALTKQPSSGRARGGGLRFGEMESTAIVCAGASVLMKTLMQQSDHTTLNSCKNCGCFAAKGKQICFQCKKQKLQEIEIPYSCKLLQQELRMMGISTKLV